MATQNSLNKTSDGFTSTVGLTANGGTISLATDATTSTIDIGTGSGVKTSTFGSINSTSATTIRSGTGALNINSTNGVVSITSGTAALNISNDSTATAVNVGTGAGVKTVIVGSITGASPTTIRSGTGALNITSTNGIMTLSSGTAALNISNNANATAVSIATGAAAKTVIIGSTNTTSALTLRYGTADFLLSSATGTVMSALDTGEITYPLQPAFLAFLPSPVNNVTGNGAQFTLGTTTALTEVFDQNGDFNTNGTFTAPVTGKYYISAAGLVTGCTIATTFNLRFIASNRTSLFQTQRAASSANLGYNGSMLVDMDTADTLTIQFEVSGEAADTCDVFGAGAPTSFMAGNLVC